MQIDLLAIGELVADLISTDYSEGLAEAKEFKMFQGGSPANVAANVNYLGKNAVIISCVGNDGIGHFLLNEIKKIGLKDTLVQVSKTKPTSIILVGKSTRTPEFIAYRGADFELEHIDNELLKLSTIVHTTAFALSRQPSQLVILDAFRTARTFGKIISVDWNFAPSIWGEDDGKAVFEKVMALQPYLKVSLDDMERFFGCVESIEEYKAMLDNHPDSFICLTCGKDGVWYREKNSGWHFQPPTPISTVIDTTGAGDAFWAGFMVALLEHQSIKECITNALLIASKKIQKQGPLYYT